jgi:hypothetical protein
LVSKAKPAPVHNRDSKLENEKETKNDVYFGEITVVWILLTVLKEIVYKQYNVHVILRIIQYSDL